MTLITPAHIFRFLSARARAPRPPPAPRGSSKLAKGAAAVMPHVCALIALVLIRLLMGSVTTTAAGDHAAAATLSISAYRYFAGVATFSNLAGVRTVGSGARRCLGLMVSCPSAVVLLLVLLVTTVGPAYAAGGSAAAAVREDAACAAAALEYIGAFAASWRCPKKRGRGRKKKGGSQRCVCACACVCVCVS